MLKALDHVIIGVRDLALAASTFSEKIGLAVSGGGVHPSGGTANRIIVIGDTYLELITVQHPDEAQQSILNRLALGEGFLNFVLASDDISADSAAIRQRGVSVLGPTAGSLTSPEGKARGWRRSDIEQPDLTQHYPFLIQHDLTGEERRDALAGWQHPPEHSSGAIKVLSTTIAVEDLREATARFGRIYGLETSQSYFSEGNAWEAELVAFPLEGGPEAQSFELAAPLLLSTTPAQKDLGPVRLTSSGGLGNYLHRYGESLCRITLGVRDLDQARRYLDRRQVLYSEAGPPPQQAIWIDPSETFGATVVLRECGDGSTNVLR